MQFIEATAFQDKARRRPAIVRHRGKPSHAEEEAACPVPETHCFHRLRKQNAVIVAGVIGVLCAGLSGCGSKAAGHEEEVRPVQAITASRSAAAVGATYSGEIRARYESKLGFKVSGKVSARLVEVGSKVVPGQVLLELDPQDASLSAASAAAQTEAARAKLQQSRLDLDREDRLYRERFVSKAALDQFQLTYDTALSQLRSAEAQQRLTQNQRAYTVLKADRAGVITSIEVEAGHVVAAGQTVLTVAADGEREVLVTVPESRVEEIRNGRGMSVSTWANPQRTYAAALRELAPDADKATRTYAARITIRDPDAALRLGMTASVLVPGFETAPAIHLPLSAIYDKAGDPIVWVVDPQTSTVAVHPVKLAAAYNDNVLLADGVKEGDIVVTAGVHMLHAGQKVKVLQPQLVVGSAK
jgi:RND family efflux transporter MFP subunit